MTFFEAINNNNIQKSILIIVTLICFGNISVNDYSFDDQYLTENKYVLKEIEGFYDIWTHPYIESGNMKVDYRPLSLSLYSIEHLIFGLNPMVSHIISIILYLICILLLFHLSKIVLKIDSIHPVLPLLILLLYAIHPSHTEVVASLKNRDEILSFIFMIISVIYFDRCFKEKEKKKLFLFIALALIFFYMSLLTKLVSLPFMASIFLWTLYSKQYKQYKVFFTLLISFAIITSLHMYSIHDYLSRNSNFYENPLLSNTEFSLRLGLGFNSLFFYLKFMLIPFPFRFYYGYNVIPFESISNPLPLLSFLIYFSMIGLLIYSIYKKKQYSYFLFCFLFMAFLYSNLLLGPYPGIVSERSMFQLSYFFIAFIFIFLFTFLNKQNSTKNTSLSGNIKIASVIYILYVLCFSFLTIKRNAEWKDSFKLIINDMKYLKESALGNYLAGVNCSDKSLELLKTDNAESKIWAENAIYYYKKAILLSPDRKQVYYRLGNLYRYSLSDLKNAEEYYIEAESKDTSTLIGMAKDVGSLYFITERFVKAIPYYEQAVKEEPENAELLFYKVLNMHNAKNIEQFLVLNADLLKKFPETQYPYLNYGTYYFNKNQSDKTSENFENAVKYGCNNPQVINYLIQYFKDKNNNEKEAYYKNKLNKQ